MIPQLLTKWVGDGIAYEAWHTPESHPQYRVCFFAKGVEINFHEFTSELKTRQGFEKLVDAAARRS